MEELRVLTSKDIATIFKLHERTVQNMMKTGGLPGCYKVASQWRVNEVDMLSYVESQKQLAYNAV